MKDYNVMKYATRKFSCFTTLNEPMSDIDVAFIHNSYNGRI